MKTPLLFALALYVPIVFVLSENGRVLDPVQALISTMGLALVLALVAGAGQRAVPRTAAAVTVTLLLTALAIRLLLGFLYDFSGRGFGAEFFLHVNWISFEIGVREYQVEIAVLLGIAVLVAWAGWRLARSTPPVTAGARLAIPDVATVLLYAGASGSPEIQLMRSWLAYGGDTGPSSVTTPEARERARRLLEPIRGHRPLPPLRGRVEAALPDTPLNLVFVYLESFNDMLGGNPDYPGLTPRLDAIKHRYLSLPAVYSSAYITIEGIANSQCGTLFNIQHANNSLITSRGRLPLLPCLGDILDVVGYRQVYLGGADLNFAGKGAFLAEHGYSEQTGWQQWKEQGYSKAGNWGLSDAVLFEQAHDTIVNLHQSGQLFNVTLLTLGTHLPGTVYEECPRYADAPGNKFLNAIHCTDFLLGRFVERLEATGLLDDTLLVLQADHGLFETGDMRALFGSDVTDTRLATVFAIPPAAAARAARIDIERRSSSSDTAATVLDLLGISHNVDFILSRSLLEPPPGADYQLSRRADHHLGQRIENGSGCEPGASSGALSLPLDPCAKAAVMAAVGDLNAIYRNEAGASNRNRVCELGVVIETAGDGRSLSVRWGTRNLTSRFYHRGKPNKRRPGDGVYVVVLDANDNVERALYFLTDNDFDRVALDKLLAGIGQGRRLMLVTSEVPGDPSNNSFHRPSQLDGKYLVYAKAADDGLEIELAVTRPLPALQLWPASCAGGPRLTEQAPE